MLQPKAAAKFFHALSLSQSWKNSHHLNVAAAAFIGMDGWPLEPKDSFSEEEKFFVERLQDAVIFFFILKERSQHDPDHWIPKNFTEVLALSLKDLSSTSWNTCPTEAGPSLLAISCSSCPVSLMSSMQ